MRLPSFGKVLVVGGAAIGVLGVLAVGVDLHAVLPPALVKIAAYKLVLLTAVGLIAAGAIVRRAEMRWHSRTDVATPARPEGLQPGAPDLEESVGGEAARLPTAEAARQRQR